MNTPALSFAPSKGPKNVSRTRNEEIGEKRRTTKALVWVLALSIVIAGVGACGIIPKKKQAVTVDKKPDAPSVGKAFHYRHTGPRPWGDGRADASGGRSVAVTGRMEEKKKPLWILEEQFEKSEGIQISSVDSDYLLHRQLLRAENGNLQVNYTPPMDLRHLTIPFGGEKNFDYRQVMIDLSNNTQVGTGKISVKTKREHDERIITPVGAVLCRHFISHVRIEAVIEETTAIFAATEETYWCDTVGWFVKEVMAFDPLIQNGEMIRPGYKTESLLIGME